MASKVIVALLLGLSVNAFAAERVTMEELAKAMELLIVDAKKQKNEIQSVKDGSEKNSAEVASEIESLKQQLSALKEKNERTEKSHAALQAKIEALAKGGAIDNRKFVIEPIREAVAAPDGALHKTTARLKVHSEPSMESPTISYLPQGAIVDVFEIHKSGMAKTGLGWVSKYYLSPLGKDKK